VKLISGALRPDEGELRMAGVPVEFRDPADARRLGIETVYQDLALCPNLSVAHNLVLGHEPVRAWGPLRIRDEARASREAARRLDRLGIRLPDPSVLIDALSGGQRQAVAVARCLEDHVRLVCLDEPTAALGVAQTEHVLELIRSLSRHGTSILMITHDVASVMQVSDRVLVLRQGRVIHESPTAQLDELELLQLMAGVGLGRTIAGRQRSEVAG
jgi:ABC-type sugar transport system ATPase subunit